MDNSTMADGESVMADDLKPVFYIGHHDSKRTEVTAHTLQQAQDCNYDMLTAPITTPYFNLRVLNVLVEHMSKSAANELSQEQPFIAALSDLDTNLGPSDSVSQLVGIVAPWIDLCSPDPAVYQVSCAVLHMEVAYAAFCGVGNLLLPSPRLHYGKALGEGVAQYASAVQHALEIATFIHFSVNLPMMDNPNDVVEETNGSLALQARSKYTGVAENVDLLAQNERKSFESQPWGLLDVRPKRKTPVSSKHDYFGTWDAWNLIRTICKYSYRLFVALVIPRYLPSASICSRWFSEPLKLLSVSSRTFYENKSGYPVLHKEHKALIHKYMRLKTPPWILLCDTSSIPGLEQSDIILQAASGSFSSSNAYENSSFPTPAEAGSKSGRVLEPLHHLNILRRLQQEQPSRTMLERYAAGFQDYLQSPLQPLTDNLESITYEVFEKDPVKYALYAEAIERALTDWRQKKKPASGLHGRVVVAVVGAGRGPLVTRALQASEVTGIPIELWALEKNQNAFVLLQRQNLSTWKNQVRLVKSDMRSWRGPSRVAEAAPKSNGAISGSSDQQHPTQHQQHYPVDILVSELLGSFADNELSPECLDGVLPLLNPSHGLSIPCSYTSYLTPVAAPRLHADIAARTPTDKEAPSTPYVVMFQAIDYLSTADKPPASSQHALNDSGATVTVPLTPHVLSAWSFNHAGRGPRRHHGSNEHNTRHTRLTFEVKERAVCHGLAGYFESVLYPGVSLSTHPNTMDEKSNGMMSWFPIFFPLKEPMYFPDHSQLTASMFRQTDGRKVWYEWMIEAWMEVPFPVSSGGREPADRKRIRLGTSESNSSKESGCMM